MSKAKKKRIDELLLELGHFEDLKTAQGFILAGKIVVDEVVCAKPGTAVREDAKIFVRGVVLKYASRGGYKLEAALARFPVSAAGKIVLDAGASTGGFTDCLLQHGAKQVYSVDVGYGQLRGKLAADPRVVNLERTNIGELTAARFDPPIELAVSDLSYLTITEAAPIIAGLFVRPVELISLIKPLSEGIPQEKKDDPATLRDALHRIARALSDRGLLISELMVSPILGSRGAVEFLALIHAAADDDGGATDPAKIERTIAELERTPPS
jgi:23S rRNA (cytidine1920-2'-O)/16S rRNA (cytidine1409-2'-O)-methyltransferase